MSKTKTDADRRKTFGDMSDDDIQENHNWCLIIVMNKQATGLTDLPAYKDDVANLKVIESEMVKRGFLAEKDKTDYAKLD